MKKTILVLVIVAALGAAWYIMTGSSTENYTATIDEEVTQLEAELAELDAAVAAGTLSVEQATEAKVKIITRLDTIQTAATYSERAALTSAQRIQLQEGLERLKNILITYQATLTAVEETADDSAVAEAIAVEVAKKRLSAGSGGGRHLNLIVADAIDSVEDTVADSVQDYEPDAELDIIIDDIIIETEADIEAEETMSDTDSTTTEETSDSATTSDDTGESMEMPIIDGDAEEMIIEGDAEVSADAEAEVTQ